MPEPTYQFIPFADDELKQINDELTAVLVAHSGEFYIKRLISDEGKIEAALQVVKKVELVPKDEPVLSPIQPNDEPNTETAQGS